MAQIDDNAVELKPNELFNVAVGRAVPQLDQLKDLPFLPTPGGGTL